MPEKPYKKSQSASALVDLLNQLLQTASDVDGDNGLIGGQQCVHFRELCAGKNSCSLETFISNHEPEWVCWQPLEITYLSPPLPLLPSPSLIPLTVPHGSAEEQGNETTPGEWVSIAHLAEPGVNILM